VIAERVQSASGPDLRALPDGEWLNLGSGPAHSDRWVNIDGSWQARLAGRPWLGWLVTRLSGREAGHWPAGIRHRDLRRGLGYPPGSVAVVYASHLIEHLHRDEALALLGDVHRALRPHGVCRVVTPDVAAIVGWYLDHKAAHGSGRASSDVLMSLLLMRPEHAPRRRTVRSIHEAATDLHSHKWMYDAEGLASLVREAGFSDVRACAYLESAIPRDALALVEAADRVCGGAGICVEARK
jgi:predicted SAM-dependent methyltransferase